MKAAISANQAARVALTQPLGLRACMSIMAGLAATMLLAAAAPAQTRYMLTLSISPGGQPVPGSITANPFSPDGKYDSGTRVTLRATSFPGYAFSHWNGADSSYVNPTWVDMYSNRDVTAAFACDYNLSQSSFPSVPASGDTLFVQVSTPNDCYLEANVAAGNDWLNVQPPTSGYGNRTLRISVAPNSSCSSRSGTVRIQGVPRESTITIIQAAGTANYTLTPSSRTHPPEGASGNVTLTTAAGCSWNASSQVYWITITSPTSGQGGSTISYSVEANPVCFPRSGTLLIAGQPFAVTQEAWAILGLVHVDCAYSGSNRDGSAQRPLLTVGQGASAACSGDTLRVFPCNYPEVFTLSKPLRLEAPQGLVIIGRP